MPYAVSKYSAKFTYPLDISRPNPTRRTPAALPDSPLSAQNATLGPVPHPEAVPEWVRVPSTHPGFATRWNRAVVAYKSVKYQRRRLVLIYSVG